MADLRFTFDSKGSEREQFFAELRRFAVENEWLPAIANEVELIFEEWLTNISSYGFTAQPDPKIHIRIQAERDQAQLEVSDNGTTFDPTLRKDPDLNIPAEQRPIGGLGIFMMKKLSRNMVYERVGDWNRLVIEKDLVTPVLTPKT